MKKGLVARFIDSKEEGSVFAICDIPKDTTPDSMKTQLSVACSKGVIVRLMRGIYHKPKYNELIDRMIPFDPDDAARAIARNNSWHIIPEGNACMNLIGISTQVPAHPFYYSDGPYKMYDIDGTVIEFRHKSPKNMPRSEKLGIVVHGMKAKGKENITSDDIQRISDYIKSNDVRIDPEELDNMIGWIRESLKEIIDGQASQRY